MCVCVCVICIHRSLWRKYKQCMMFIYRSLWRKYKQVSVKRTFKTSATWLFTSLNCVQGNEYVHERAIYVQRKMDVHRGVGTYTVRVGHWFESSFTGNNAPFNTNGIHLYIQTKQKRTTEVYLCLSKKYLYCVQIKICMERIWYVQGKDMYVHKECWFVYTQVKWKQTIEVCLYLSIKGISVLCTDKNLYVSEESLICTKKYYVHKRMLWDLHREGGPLVSEKSHREWFLSSNQWIRCINKRMKTNERSLFMFEY